MDQIQRSNLINEIQISLTHFPVVALLGPRQAGKTSLARTIFARRQEQASLALNYLDLEDPTSLTRLASPKLALEPLTGLVVIDEIQRMPELFPILRVLADRNPRPATFLVLGSASPELIRQSSETLAGRIKYLDVMPFSLIELEPSSMLTHWLRGGYAPSFLAPSDAVSSDWRMQYIRTFLEQDLRVMGIDVAPDRMRRLWMMLCHFHGQILNVAEIAQSMDISASTAKKYIDILCQTFMLRRLNPWFENIAKRQVKSAKLFFRDSGLFHQLLGIKSYEDLLIHPSMGRSWEGYVLEQLIRSLGVPSEECHFWGVHSQGEVDLLVGFGRERRAFEIKHTLTPKITPSIELAIKTLKLKRVDIVYRGEVDFPIARNVFALSAATALCGKN